MNCIEYACRKVFSSKIERLHKHMLTKDSKSRADGIKEGCLRSVAKMAIACLSFYLQSASIAKPRLSKGIIISVSSSMSGKKNL